MRIPLLLIVVLLACMLPGKAQDTVLMINGRQKIVNVHEVNTRLLYVSYQNIRSNRAKLKGLELLEVYSIGYKDSVRRITYVQDTNIGFPLTEEQMGSYISGTRYAMQHHKGAGYWVAGAVAGFSGPYFLGYFYGLLVPAAATGVSGAIPPGTRQLAKKEPLLYADPHFVAGYKHKARKKNVLNALYGSLIGVGAAAIVTTVVVLSQD